jgi:polysaccharide export outer membrane protein
MISLPLLNDVQAAGLTPLELRAALIKKLAEFIPDPEVSVIVTDVRSLKVSVIGQVARPGRYEFRSWATVVDVLAMAGGLSDFAAKSRITVFRPNGRATKRIPFNYEKLGAKDDEQVNFFVRPGDLVFVP